MLASTKLVAGIFGVVGIAVILAKEIGFADKSERGVDFFLVVGSTGVPAQGTFSVRRQAQFLLEVIPLLVLAVVVDIQWRTVVVLPVEVIVILVAGIGGQRRKIKVVVDTDANAKDVGLIGFAV